MREPILEPGYTVSEAPISYSLLTCALFDLETVGDEASIENARAAYYRGLAGPAPEDAWMSTDGTGLWEEPVTKLGKLLGITRD